MNGKVCCILGVCCPAGSVAQRRALEDEMIADGADPAAAKKMAKWVLTHFDLAPVGTLGPFRSAIMKMARKPKP